MALIIVSLSGVTHREPMLSSSCIITHPERVKLAKATQHRYNIAPTKRFFCPAKAKLNKEAILMNLFRRGTCIYSYTACEGIIVLHEFLREIFAKTAQD